LIASAILQTSPSVSPQSSSATFERRLSADASPAAEVERLNRDERVDGCWFNCRCRRLSTRIKYSP
jgi:hypothetical protein